MEDNSASSETVEAPRENLIATAVTFLQNPKVTQSPTNQKRTFLEKKGLSKEEIDIAFSRAGVVESVSGSAAVPPAQHVVPYPHGQPMPVAVPEPQSRWMKVRDYTATIIVIGGISYGIYHLYKKYLMPLWYGPSPEEKQMKALEKSIADLQKSLSEMVTCVKDMQASQQRQTNNMSATSIPSSSEVDRTFVNEVKDEIKSLKGLMLSRKQFPPPPVTQPVLPAWQLAMTKTEEDSPSSDTGATGGVAVERKEEIINGDEAQEIQPSLEASQKSSSHVLESNGVEVSSLVNGHVESRTTDDVEEENHLNKTCSSSPPPSVPIEPTVNVIEGQAQEPTLNSTQESLA